MRLEMFGKKFKIRKFSILHWLMLGVMGACIILPMWATAVLIVGLLR